MRLFAALKAFWLVLTGVDLVPRAAVPAAPAPEAKPAAPESNRFVEGAIFTLVLFQRAGRLVDFLRENLEGYTDEQIGAAVRKIHLDSAKVLAENFGLVPVVDSAEGGAIELPADFDRNRIKLTGNVPAKPPFKGTLVHKGWRAGAPQFPARNVDAIDPTVVQPAEVQA